MYGVAIQDTLKPCEHRVNAEHGPQEGVSVIEVAPQLKCRRGWWVWCVRHR
jgi:hypothetical protein